MANQSHTGLKRLINATVYSWRGFRAAYRHEEAFRQELLLCLVLIPLAFWLGDDGVERALLIGSLLLLLMVELLNTAVENAIDRIGLEPHKLSGRAKDVGSAAVFIALVNTVVIWLLVLLG